MKIGQTFKLLGADSETGEHAIDKGYVTVGEDYTVCERDSFSPSYWFKDNVGYLINTYEFVIEENKP